MFRQIRASRLKTFILLSAISAAATTCGVAALWSYWSIADIARNLGMLPDPLRVGLVASLVPIYFIALDIWLPMSPRRSERGVCSKPMSDAEIHWHAIRIIGVVCILLTDLVAQFVPSHPLTLAAAHAAIR